MDQPAPDHDIDSFLGIETSPARGRLIRRIAIGVAVVLVLLLVVRCVSGAHERIRYSTVPVKQGDLLAVLLLPVMPASCEEILKRAGETVPVADLDLDRDAVWKSSLVRSLSRAPSMWPRLCRALGREDLIDHPRISLDDLNVRPIYVARRMRSKKCDQLERISDVAET